METESTTSKAERTKTYRATLRAPDAAHGFHLPRLAYAVQAFAKDPSSGNRAALDVAMDTYDQAEARAKREAFLAVRESMREHLGIPEDAPYLIGSKAKHS